MSIHEYLKKHGAIGINKAITTNAICNALQVNRRQLVDVVAKERAAGALICSTTGGKGGYYLPASVEEIKQQKEKLENGIRERANAVRPFRDYMEKYNRPLPCIEQVLPGLEGASYDDAKE